jgi:hypothetical protein
LRECFWSFKHLFTASQPCEQSPASPPSPSPAWAVEGGRMVRDGPANPRLTPHRR